MSCFWVTLSIKSANTTLIWCSQRIIVEERIVEFLNDQIFVESERYFVQALRACQARNVSQRNQW